MAIKIVVISDSGIFQDDIKRTLELDQDCKVVAESRNTENALLLVDTYKPDVVIIDMDMNNRNGMEVCRQLFVIYRELKVIMLSNEDDENIVMDALNLGINGYLLKERYPEFLVNAVKLVLDGGCLLDPKITLSLVNGYRRLVAASVETEERKTTVPESRGDIRRPLHLLTRRECEVLQLLADGKSNRGISESIFISEKTVKNHVSSILQKMNAKDRTHAVVVAIKNGWVEVR